MLIESLHIQGSAVITISPKYDERGYFYRIFCNAELKEIFGLRCLSQINYSCTKKKGTVRGLHFQYPPYAEMKFIRCIKGEIFDVLVDVRKNSPTFLKWYGIILSEKNHRMICIPEGCAHGFQVLAECSELLYLHTAPYMPDFEGALSPLDPQIGIEWPLPIKNLSERDRNHPFICDQFMGLIL